MPASSRVRVIVINSLSYTGTTWLNAVLGSHDDAFALGPADRIWEIRRNGWDGACLIHGEACAFWPKFHQRYDPDGNFFVQLAEASGKYVIVTNNLSSSGAGTQLRHRDIDVRHVHFVRDGRSLGASFCRHLPQKSFMDAIVEFLQPSFHNFHFDPDNTDIFSLRYEDLLAEKFEYLNRLGKFVGLDYEDSAIRFWEHEQHLTSGNQGVVALIRFGQNLSVQNFKSREFYECQFQRMRENEGAPFEDERWRQELSRRELFQFDVFAGADNARFGYERDGFSLDEVSRYSQELAALLAEGGVPRPLLDLKSLTAHERQNGAMPDYPFGHAAGTSRGTLGLFRQLDPAMLRAHGLYLSPSQLRAILKLALKIGGPSFILLILLVLALAIWV